MKTQTILINAHAHAVWVAGDTLEAAQAEADALAGHADDRSWTAISRRQYDDAPGAMRYIAVEVPAGEWEAGDADRALSEGTVLGYWRVDEIADEDESEAA